MISRRTIVLYGGRGGGLAHYDTLLASGCPPSPVRCELDEGSTPE